ncbi:MAG TPA: DUF790 family protein, partial [Ktedonobacteraceae bacterium]|nr:DUF790 family protein [Ktedonobacteraceae bacterium]
ASHPVGADLSRPSPIYRPPIGDPMHRHPVDNHPSPDIFVKNHSRPSSIFDSSIEQSFSEAFVALANSQAADGWQLEREPEPLLLNAASGETSTQSIFIPDFAMTRGSRRIYVEILGFWTASYRERKIARLQQLKERDDLVLAIPIEARAAFAAIASDFPIVEYDGQLSATELLQVLRSRYDDVEERLAGIDVEMVRERIMKEGLLPERICFELLHCYRRSELQRAAQRIVTATIAFTTGVGLYAADWLEHLKVSFVQWIGSVTSVQSAQEIPLQEALLHCRLQSPVLEQCEDAAIEALISLWPEVSVSRSSIFDAAIHLVNNVEADLSQSSANATGANASHSLVDPVGADLSRPSPIHRPSRNDTNDKTHTGSAPRKQVRERRATYKKNNTNQTIQGDLWG